MVPWREREPKTLDCGTIVISVTAGITQPEIRENSLIPFKPSFTLHSLYGSCAFQMRRSLLPWERRCIVRRTHYNIEGGRGSALPGSMRTPARPLQERQQVR